MGSRYRRNNTCICIWHTLGLLSVQLAWCSTAVKSAATPTSCGLILAATFVCIVQCRLPSNLTTVPLFLQICSNVFDVAKRAGLWSEEDQKKGYFNFRVRCVFFLLLDGCAVPYSRSACLTVLRCCTCRPSMPAALHSVTACSLAFHAARAIMHISRLLSVWPQNWFSSFCRMCTALRVCSLRTRPPCELCFLFALLVTPDFGALESAVSVTLSC
jgi:hypothetical protein